MYISKLHLTVLSLPIALLRSTTASILEWYPRIPYRDCNRRWTGTFFYCRDVPTAEDGIGIPVFVNSPPIPRDSWDEKVAVFPDHLRLIQRRTKFLTSAGLASTDIVLCLLTRRIQLLRHCLRLMCETISDADDPLRVSSQLLPKQKLLAHFKGLLREGSVREEEVFPMYTSQNWVTMMS